MTQIEVQVNDQKVKHILVRFNGHITSVGRGDGLPPVIYAFLILENANDDFINKMVEEQSSAFIRSQSMYVQREQGAIIDIRAIPQDRMLVPFHNIAFIDVDISPMMEMPMPDENGIQRLSNGTEPMKQ